MLKSKNAIVTGGSDGIGFAIAKELVINGASILIIGRDPNKLNRAKNKLSKFGTTVEILMADLSKTESLKLISHNIHEKMGTIDILINNAGIAKFIAFEKMDKDLLNLHINLNVVAPYLLTSYLYESIKQSKGNILNISSYFSDRMLPGRDTTAYSLTKGAINSFTKSLAFEAGKDGVRVNAIAPGSIDTELLKSNINLLNDEGRASFQNMIEEIYPLKHIGKPEDVAKMAAFLVSDDAKWITGSIINVDGGLTTN